MRLTICNLILALAAGCASQRATPGMQSPDSSPSKKPPTTQPILYHRTGGFAGTDDRVVIWSDGFIQVTGKLLASANSIVPSDRLHHLVTLFKGWEKLDDQYRASNVADDYIITIDYGGKTIVASDLAPNLPGQFSRIYNEIESIAAAAASTPAPPAP